MESSSDSVEKGERMTKKLGKSLCFSCSVHCSECFDKDTFVYECDDYKKEKNDNKRINEGKS